MLKNVKRKGFTIIEIVITIAILGILVLIASPRFLGYTKDAQVASMQSDARVLSNAAAMYSIDVGEYPIDTTADKTGITLPTGITGTFELLDKALLKDHIKSIGSDYSNYIIITDGEHEGEVFHKDGVVDRDGNMHYGVDLEIPAP